MSQTIHDKIAEKLAEKNHTEYNANKGINIVTNKRVIEVETKKEGLEQGIKQIQRSSKARYLAVNSPNIKNAVNITEGTGIGVMSNTGRIIKKASRS